MKRHRDPKRFQELKTTTERETEYRIALEKYIAKSIGSHVEKMQNFTKYAPRQSITKFLSRYEIFKKILSVQGSIVECGVLFGGGLMTWAQLSAIFEPVNYQRKIIGFDTFAGFTSITKEDRTGTSELVKKGGLAVDSYEDLKESIRLYDLNRSLSHINKVILVKGDIKKTVPRYLKKNPHTVVSLLYIDVDVYEPTVVALRHFVPRIPKGGIIAFDELNAETFPGETIAVLKEIGINNLRIQRFPFDTFISYAILE